MDDKEKKIKQLKENIITFVISLSVGAIIFCLYFFLKSRTIVDACNASIMAAVILVSLGLLIWLTRLGAFDTFAYGFKQLGHAMFGRSPTKYHDMIEYKQDRYEKRKDKTNYYLFIIIAGLCFGVATLVLEIIYHTMIGG